MFRKLENPFLIFKKENVRITYFWTMQRWNNWGMEDKEKLWNRTSIPKVKMHRRRKTKRRRKWTGHAWCKIGDINSTSAGTGKVSPK